MKLSKAIQSEFIKLRYPPILWLTGFVITITMFIIFIAHYLDIHNAIRLGVNPWFRINNTGQAIFAMFIGTPFVILLISAILSIEHQNFGFKQLYTLPKRRQNIVLYKLMIILLYLLLILFVLIIGLIAIGILLNIIFPETGFSYYKIPLTGMLFSSGEYLVSVLGIIGIQFFLSIRFKGLIVPASIGILAYTIGFILTSLNNSLSLYFPYCYTIIVKEDSPFGTSSFEIKQFAFLNEVHLYSIIVFFSFILLSLITERSRNT